MNDGPRYLGSEGHVVGFYRDDKKLIDEVAEYLIEGVNDGGRALVLATAAHRHELRESLGGRGIDGGSAGASGMVHFVDAAETLSQFMVDGSLDADRFAAAVGDLIDQAGRGRVRVYGEMVQLLWEAGHVNAALQLDNLWNDLADGRDFSLFCAYRSETVSADPDAREALCRLHTAVVGVDANNIAMAELAAGSDSPGRARRLVADALLRWEWTGDYQAAMLIVTELSANAVVHSSSPFRVSVTRREDVVRISVADLDPGVPVLMGPSPREASGRGLGIVAALADRWGHDMDSLGKEVWAEIS